MSLPPSGDAASGGDADTDCPPSARLIYVTGEPANLYSYDPPTGQFTEIGPLNCLDSPTHMTVDRHGTAWVVSNGQLYKASTANASCSAVATWTPNPVFADFALTFLGVTSGTDDSLYVLSDGYVLALFNTASGSLSTIGTVSVSEQRGTDMTTNGDGYLFVQNEVTNQALLEVSPTNASVLHSYITGQNAEQSSAALAYYGGLFYDFIGSEVYTFDVSTRALATVGMAPLEVTGAGQSTCVPNTAPPPAQPK